MIVRVRKETCLNLAIVSGGIGGRGWSEVEDGACCEVVRVVERFEIR
jgi:hypothetical protein